MSCTDHPRSRGVYRTSVVLRVLSCGSSPLARGLPGCGKTLMSLWGIIPARAGFTVTTLRSLSACTDHPRSRGVYYVSFTIAGKNLGSSPLARGLLSDIFRRAGNSGIIPARAGFTCTTGKSSARPWDHPRSRGVYSTRAKHCIPGMGSSPLARGLLAAHRQLPQPARIIPARAGFTLGLRSPTSPVRDHPRSRGVYTAGRWQLSSTHGSSPLARGLLSMCHDLRPGEGIIPARAGFTAIS